MALKVERFRDERESDWRELDELLGRPRRARRDARSVLHLAALYRGAAADLALARRRYRDDPIVVRLESLVVRARQAVYSEEPRRASPREFFARTYWQRVRERPAALWIAIALLLIPAALAAAWALDDPGAALGLVPGELRGAVEPVGDTGMTATESAAFSSAVLTNNIQVTFLAFAAGILFGLGTAVVLAYNGATLGAITGGAIGAGNGEGFVEFVAAHGIIELTCIAVAAGAGLRVGYALVAPGARPRREALALEARAAIAIILGTLPWVVLAGLIEGFVTRAGFGLWPGLILGLGVGAVYWTLVIVRGRPERTALQARLTAARATSP